MSESMRERAVGLAYAAGWAGLRALPHRVAAAGFQLGADLSYRRQGAGVRRLAGNLARVAPQLSEVELADLTKRAMRSYARYWLETFRLPVMDRDSIVANIEVTGEEHLKAAIASGRGVLIPLPHMGNYEIAGVWMAHRDLPLTTVAERLKPESLFRRFLAFREAIGMEVLPFGPADPSPGPILAARLRAGGTVCLVADRDLTAAGIEVNFFGESAKMPAGPAFLAATTGAALIPLRLNFVGAGWGMHFHPEIPIAPGARLRERVTGTTQRLADVFAADIAEHPQDWHMLQRMWLADPGPAAA